MGAVREKRVLGICLTLCLAQRGVVLVALDEPEADEQLARRRFEFGIVEVMFESEIDLLSWSNALSL